MKLILIAGALALVFSLFGTPALIKVLARRGYGQIIRDDGPVTHHTCLLYTSPSPRDRQKSRMPSSA